jgi:hypothetical protein
MKDGGPAFPIHEIIDERNGNVTQYAHGGMTLRDYFAAKAMSSLISLSTCGGGLNSEGTWLVSASYKWADAMLAEREKCTTK